MSDKLVINADDLTVGDLEFIEEYTGENAGAVFQENFSAKSLTALVYVVKRREDADYTLDDARKVKFGEIDITSDEELAKQGDTSPS